MDTLQNIKRSFSRNPSQKIKDTIKYTEMILSFVFFAIQKPDDESFKFVIYSRDKDSLRFDLKILTHMKKHFFPDIASHLVSLNILCL